MLYASLTELNFSLERQEFEKKEGAGRDQDINNELSGKSRNLHVFIFVTHDLQIIFSSFRSSSERLLR